MTDAEHIEYSPNKAIDREVRDLLAHFSADSQKRMRKAIINKGRVAKKHRNENTDAEARHVFREFLPAAVLNRHGHSLEYECTIDGQTPDWIDLEGKLLMESYTFERGGSSGFRDRVSSAIADKCAKYKKMAARHSCRVVVAVYIDFLTCVTLDEVREDPEWLRPLFAANPCLCAVLFFTETQVISGRQEYGYFAVASPSQHGSCLSWPFPTEALANQGPR
jgi:hypothetical protein